MREVELLKKAGYDVSLYEQTGKSDPAGIVYPLSQSKLHFLKFLLSIDHELVHFHFANTALFLSIALPLLLIIMESHALFTRRYYAIYLALLAFISSVLFQLGSAKKR